jgi:peptide/nickel transport system permease protein
MTLIEDVSRPNILRRVKKFPIIRILEPGGCLGLFLVGVTVIAAIFAPIIAPFDPLEQDLRGRLKPPLWTDSGGELHILGTDELGRDIFSRLIFGSRVTLSVALTAVPISAFLGTLLGLSAGFIRGTYENVIMRLLDVQLALPFILLALAVLVAIGPSFRNIVLLLGVTGWTQYARLLRAETISIKERDFVLAAETIGAGRWRIIFRHILPNTLSTIIVLVTLQMPQVIIIEASLSFLGLGIQPPAPSWGGMLTKGRSYLLNEWWVPLFPGLAITFVALGGNLMGDWLTTVFNPFKRRRK